MKMSPPNCSVKMSSPYGDFHDEQEGSATCWARQGSPGGQDHEPGGRLLEGVERAQAQFADEAVLQRSPEAFDAAFGLRRLRGDEPDAEGLEHAPEMAGDLVAPQPFGERSVPLIALEEAGAIPVERHEAPVLSARLPQHSG